MSEQRTVIIVAEIDIANDCKHLRYVRFPLDGGKEFCYRSRTSINGFAYSGSRRNYRPSYKNAVRLYHFNHWYENKPRLNNIEPGVEIVEVASIWEFYKLIGYDYKTKKWSPLEIEQGATP